MRKILEKRLQENYYYYQNDIDLFCRANRLVNIKYQDAIILFNLFAKSVGSLTTSPSIIQA